MKHEVEVELRDLREKPSLLASEQRRLDHLEAEHVRALMRDWERRDPFAAAEND
jgi:hypothetical protein